MTKIPKIIHYIWLGKKEKPELFKKCIDSFYEFHKDWKIIEWNEDNIKMNSYIETCLKNNTVVKATDFIRLQVIHEFGGIYLDADMEIFKSLDPLLDNYFFTGYELKDVISYGIIGSTKNNEFVKKCMTEFLQLFDGSQHNVEGGPRFLSKMIHKYYKNVKYSNEVKTYDNELTLYPIRYFYPYYYDKEFSLDCITPDTYTAHHWAFSWRKGKYYNKILNA